MTRLKIYLALIVLMFLSSCQEIKDLVQPESPRERYLRSLQKAGLTTTALLREWQRIAAQSLHDSLRIELPYKEEGYFFNDRAEAAAFTFLMQRGEKIVVKLNTASDDSFRIFMDLFEVNEKGNIEEADFLRNGQGGLEYKVRQNGNYILRLQPELLRGGRYTFTIESAPSLTFPVAGKNSKAIQSFWGAARNGGSRRHEGIDIFAARGTPVVAATDGVIMRAGTNRLGGKVLFLYSEGYSLYYAYLDSQWVGVGKQVKAGDTIGLVGNTGNAAHTAPHLHFGIYARGEGAIDPYLFVKDIREKPEDISADLTVLGSMKRTSSAVRGDNMPALDRNTPFTTYAASSNNYRARLPNGTNIFLGHRKIEALRPIRKESVPAGNVIYDMLFGKAIPVKIFETDTSLTIYGAFNGYSMVRFRDRFCWIQEKG